MIFEMQLQTFNLAQLLLIEILFFGAQNWENPTL